MTKDEFLDAIDRAEFDVSASLKPHRRGWTCLIVSDHKPHKTWLGIGRSVEDAMEMAVDDMRVGR